MPILSCPPRVGATSLESRVAPFLNLFARPLPECDIASDHRFTLGLDPANRLVRLPSEWETFTEMIGAPGLERERVLGRPVGWFMDDETVRECFRLMWERARLEGRSARIAARCDGLDENRALQFTSTPTAAGALECSWTILRGPAATITPAVQRHRFREGEHLRMCSWCRQVHLGMMWHRLDSAAPALGLLDHTPLPPITHGICPECFAVVMAENRGLR